MPSPPDRRASILSAARHLFLEQGYEGTSMEAIRSTADVSNGSLFHHFPTKENLASTLYIGAMQSYQAAVLGELERHKSPQRAIIAVLEAHFGWVANHVDEARCLHEMRRSPAVRGAEGQLAAVNAPMFARVRAWLVKQVERGLVRDLPLEVFIPVVLGPAMEFTKAWLGSPKPKRITRAAPLFADAAWRAIRAEEG